MTGRDRLRERAAVLVYFDSDSFGAPSSQPALPAFLAEECQRVVGADGVRHWALTDQCRRVAAESLGLNGLVAMARKKTPPRPDHPVQRAIDLWFGTPSDASVDGLDADGLRALQQVVLWFGWVGHPSLPTLDDVVGRLAAIELYRPLRELVGEHFRGRADLLARIDEHVRSAETTALMLWGPGGVGKSTVVAHYLLSHPDLVFVYLNFDRAVLDPMVPRSIFVEGARQLGLRYPEHAELADRVRSGLLDAESVGIDQGSHWVGQTTDTGTETDRDTLSALAELVHAVAGGDREFVLVLDTVEEIQRAGRFAVEQVVGHLRELRALAPQLRTLLVGRTAPVTPGIEVVRVGDFDRESAAGYLLARVPDLSETDLASVLERVPRNPLSLRLAADLINSGTDRATALLALGHGQVQGVLYRRVLDHIEDPDVQAIAHPGLVLRRIVPELITQVLARPCGLRGTRSAQELFLALEREATLVERRDDDPGALWHRADVRELMLPTLGREHPGRVRAIHRGAIRFYEGEDGDIARAEELYHRMMLGQRPATLLRAWSDAAAPRLRGALAELPEEARLFLAARIGGDVADALDEQVRANADQRTRAAQVQNRVRRMMRTGRVAEAYELVTTERGPHGESLVPALEIEVREHYGDLTGAIDCAQRYRAKQAKSGNDRDYVITTLALARLQERTGEHAKSIDTLIALRTLVTLVDDESALLEVNVTLLRLARQTGHRGIDRDELIRETVRVAEELGAYRLAKQPALLRALGAEVGDVSDTVLAAAMRHVGLDLTTERDMPARLADAITSFDAEVSPKYGRDSGVVLKSLPGKGDTNLADLLSNAGTRAVSNTIAQNVEDHGSTPALRAELVEFYREQNASAYRTKGSAR